VGKVELNVLNLRFLLTNCIVDLPTVALRQSALSCTLQLQQIKTENCSIIFNQRRHMQTEGIMGHLRRLCDVDVLLHAKLLPKDGYRAANLHMRQLLLAIDQYDCLLFNLVSNEAPLI
jgi:hypothetical protein